jgi:glycosyltransferase involved in cell wall biosynthesis
VIRDWSDVTIVIPAKDEAPTIGDVVGQCLPWAREVVVVDGHSRDNTIQVARDAGARVLMDHGGGKGDAIRTSIPEVKTRITVFLDADGSHDPRDVPRLVEPIRAERADHVSASRLIGGSSELHGGFDEFFRLAGCAFITACVNRRFGVRLSDTQNGYRAIRTDVLRALDLRENSTTIEQEMVMKTIAAGFRITEVASHERARLHGQSHIHLWRVAPRYGYCLAKNLIAPGFRRLPAPRAVVVPAGMSALRPRE